MQKIKKIKTFAFPVQEIKKTLPMQKIIRLKLQFSLKTDMADRQTYLKRLKALCKILQDSATFCKILRHSAIFSEIL